MRCRIGITPHPVAPPLHCTRICTHRQGFLPVHIQHPTRKLWPAVTPVCLSTLKFEVELMRRASN